MKLTIYSKALSVITLFLLSNEVWTQPITSPITNRPLKTAMPILTVVPDARASGMGDVGAATGPSINDQAWNCAKYVFNEYEMGISLSYVPWMRNVGTTNINLLYLTGFYQLDDRQAIGASIRYFSLGNIRFMDNVGNPVRTANPNEFSIDASYSLRLGEFFSLGAAFRYLRSDLTGGHYTSHETAVTLSPANGAAADIGFFYYEPIRKGGAISNVSAGLSITNIGTKMSYAYDKTIDKGYFLPTTLRLAGGLELSIDYNNTIAFSLEFSKYLVPTPPVYAMDDQGNIITDDNGKPIIIAGRDDGVSVPMGMIQSFYDAPDGFSGELRKIMTGVGAEYNYANIFKIRTGFYYDPKNAQHRYVTIGAGLIYSLFSFDISYLIPIASGLQSPLANTIHATIGVNIGQPNRY